MFQDLDATLVMILGNGAAPAELQAAEVRFEPPDKSFVLNGPTVNLFLYEVKEHRELRDPEPIVVRAGATFVRRMPPLRVEGVYLVTTWSDKAGPAKIVEEHLLLGQALAWLSRFPVIPATFLQGSLVGQPFPPPTMVAQMDANKNAGEFWSALGSTPRPAFYLSVTISIDLGLETPEGPPVVTKELVTEMIGEPGTTEDIFEIWGIVRNANTSAPIAQASVTLVELDREAMTDAQGVFQFSTLETGNYTLRTAATGFTTQDNSIAVPGTVINAYDVSLMP